jgi:hypothetical protein
LSLRHKPVLRDRLFTAVLAGAFAHGFYLMYPFLQFLYACIICSTNSSDWNHVRHWHVWLNSIMSFFKKIIIGFDMSGLSLVYVSVLRRLYIKSVILFCDLILVIACLRFSIRVKKLVLVFCVGLQNEFEDLRVVWRAWYFSLDYSMYLPCLAV